MPERYDEIVGYDTMDYFKREAQRCAAGTAKYLARFGLEEIPECRGDSAHVVKMLKPRAHARAYERGPRVQKPHSPVIERCLVHNVKIHYAINIMGHGWRKLLRHPDPWAYVIEMVPRPQPIFRWIQELGGLDDREMYKTFNMGAGFALIIPGRDVCTVIGVCRTYGIETITGGRVEKSSRKQAVIMPKNIEFNSEDLNIS